MPDSVEMPAPVKATMRRGVVDQSGEVLAGRHIDNLRRPAACGASPDILGHAAA